MPDLFVFAIGSLECLVDLLEIVEWHKLTQFAESACQILRAVDDSVQVAHADLLRVDLAEHLGVALALDRHGAVDLDVAIAVVIHGFYAFDPAHLHQNERNRTSLVLEVDVHTLSKQAFAN